MEYVGGTSLKQLLKQRMKAAGGKYDAAPGRPGDRLRPRDPARLPVPPRPQPDLLRLQAGQHHPGRRRGQADRPRRRAPARRPRLRDLRHDRLPGARGADRRPVGRLRHLHDRAHPDACSRWSSAATRAPTSPRCRRSTRRPLFQAHDSFYRLLLKACAPDPADRFVSADELRVQLLGVLREVVALGREGAAEHSASSLLFWSPDGLRRRARLAGPARAPGRRERHPGAAGCGRSASTTPAQRLAALRAARRRSAPRCCWPGRAPRWRPGDHDLADSAAQELLAEDPWEWRAAWMAGLVALARGRTGDAQSAFNAVYGQVPGELAPKLALAFACETGGEARRGRVALRHLRPDRRQLHRARRVRPGRGSARPR